MIEFSSSPLCKSIISGPPELFFFLLYRFSFPDFQLYKERKSADIKLLFSLRDLILFLFGTELFFFSSLPVFSRKFNASRWRFRMKRPRLFTFILFRFVSESFSASAADAHGPEAVVRSFSESQKEVHAW